MYRPIAFAVIFALVGCVDKEKSEEKQSSKNYYSEYSKSVDDYNIMVGKYNELLEGAQEGARLLVGTGDIIVELDSKARTIREMNTVIRARLSAINSAEELKSDMKTLEDQVYRALAIISNLEKRISKENIDLLKEAAPSLYNPDFVEYERTLLETRRTLASQLAGMRDLFLAQYNDLTGEVNKRLQELSANPISRNTDRNEPSAQVDPRVNSLAEGGRITGVARNSRTGAPVSGAFVGFKKLPESREYFFTTTTDNNGVYRTPYLRADDYYVDIRHPDLIEVPNQRVRVTTGTESNENLSMTEALAAGVYRITMSWGAEKANAVKDVDSYLLTPESGTPIYYSFNRNNIADLDRDDTDWIGPETITIRNLASGSYRYYVNNYNYRNNPTALGNSEIRIKVYRENSLIKDYIVPQGTGLTYEVFRIENGRIIDIGKYDDSLRVY